MAAHIVDSSGWMEYFAGSERAALFASAIEDRASLIVPVVSLYEVFKKFLRERDENQAVEAVGAMMQGNVIELDAALALESARHRLPLADSIIYATTCRYKATLFTQDKDFDGLEYVKYFPKPALN